MANNFRLSGIYYCAISSISSDANAGTSTDTPKRTIAAITGITNSTAARIVASGYYFGAIVSATGLFTNTTNFFADGHVVADGNGGLFSSAYLAQIWNDFNFINFSQVYSTGGVNMTFNRCMFNLITRIGDTAGGTKAFNSCIFIGVTFNNSTTCVFADCIFINCTFTTIGTFVRCYFDAASIPYSAVNAGVGDNDIEGFWKVNLASVITTGVIIDNLGKYYDLSLAGIGGTGTIGDPFYRGNTVDKSFALNYHVIAYPTMNTQSFNANPLFNNVSILDFSVGFSSPLLSKNSVYNVTVGNVSYALGFYPNVSPELLESNGAIISGLTGTSDLTVTSGSGYLQSAPIQYSATNITEIGKVSYVGNLAFDKTQTPPVARNQNVPDADIYTGSVAGATPDRLIYKFRISSKSLVHFVSLEGTSTIGSDVISMSSTTGILVGDEVSGDGIPQGATVLSIIPNTSITISANSTKAITKYLAFTAIADWDNLGIALPSVFMIAPWNEKPYYDNAGIVSGEPTWNIAQKNILGATYIQIKVELTNNYTL